VVRSHSRLPIPLQTDRRGIAIFSEAPPETRMLKFLGSTIGNNFLIGLTVTTFPPKAIF